MPFATHEDFEQCRRLHQTFGTSYYMASRLFPAETRRQVDAVYGFVRVPDEWVDNPGERTVEEVARLLSDFRKQLRLGFAGEPPEHPVLRAFVDVAATAGIPIEEAELFLDAMEMDLSRTTYREYAALQGYMRGSAVAVGHMMCHVVGAVRSPEVRDGAASLAEAMQLTNFLRDVAEDFRRGRVYLPLEEMGQFGVTLDSLRACQVTPEFVALMKFQIERARGLYEASDPAIDLLPSIARPAVRAARALYSRILDRIEAQGYDVFCRRARTSRAEKLWLLAQCFASGQRSET